MIYYFDVEQRWIRTRWRLSLRKWSCFLMTELCVTYKFVESRVLVPQSKHYLAEINDLILYYHVAFDQSLFRIFSTQRQYHVFVYKSSVYANFMIFLYFYDCLTFLFSKTCETKMKKPWNMKFILKISTWKIIQHNDEIPYK